MTHIFWMDRSKHIIISVSNNSGAKKKTKKQKKTATFQTNPSVAIEIKYLISTGFTFPSRLGLIAISLMSQLLSLSWIWRDSSGSFGISVCHRKQTRRTTNVRFHRIICLRFRYGSPRTMSLVTSKRTTAKSRKKLERILVSLSSDWNSPLTPPPDWIWSRWMQSQSFRVINNGNPQQVKMLQRRNWKEAWTIAARGGNLTSSIK